MATRQLHEAEPMFIDDGITDGFNYPSSSNAIYDALQGGGAGGGSIFFVTAPGFEVGDRTDKTAQEILDAYLRGDLVILTHEDDYESSTEYNYDTLLHIQHYVYQDGRNDYDAKFGRSSELMGDDPNKGLFYAD